MRFLVFEYISPDVGGPLFPALLYIQMLAMLSGAERSETQWKELLGGGPLGLEIAKFGCIVRKRRGRLRLLGRYERHFRSKWNRFFYEVLGARDCIE